MQIRSHAATLLSVRGRRIAAVAVIAVGTLVWWWYPTLANEDAGTDVAIVGDSFLQEAEREVTYRIHEDGFSLAWAARPELTWCDAAEAVRAEVERVDPEIVVVSFADEGSCGTDPVVLRQAVRTAAGGAKLIVVANPWAEDAPVPDDSEVVRPSRLIGPVGTTEQGCLWFDTHICRPDGNVEVRTADGALSPSGQTRVARMIVTALR